MANDRLQELYEQKNVDFQRIEELRGKVDEWADQDKADWQEVNQRYDATLEEIESIERRQEVDSRMAAIAERDEEKQHARRTEVGQARSNRSRTNVTEEQRARALFSFLAPNRQRRAADEEALFVMGLDRHVGRCSEIAINMGTGHTSGFNVISSGNGSRALFGEFDQRFAKEFRGPLDTQTATEGAEWVPAETFRAELIKTMIAFGVIRGVVRTIQTTGGEPFKMPTGDDTANSAAIKLESSTGTPVSSDFTDPTTGELVWNAYKYNAGVKWSWEMQQDSPLALQAILAEMIGERQGRGQAAHFTTGTGTGQPQGITVGATDSGVSWSLSGTEFTNGDALIDAQATLDPAYAMTGNVMWMMSRATLAEVRKLKSGSGGNYLWQPGLQAGTPDLLLGDPVVMNQSMPALSGTNRAIVYGDMSRYIIRDAGMLRLRVLNELYAETDQIGMISWWRTDGKVALPAAIKYVAAAV